MTRNLIVHAFVCALAVAAGIGKSNADEGMWTFDHFPSGKVKAAYGF